MGVDFGQEGDGTLAQGKRAQCTVYLTMTRVHRLGSLRCNAFVVMDKEATRPFICVH